MTLFIFVSFPNVFLGDICASHAFGYSSDLHLYLLRGYPVPEMAIAGLEFLLPFVIFPTA
ncbi:hypothetical protein ES703_125364 [subsurface metagenome]